MPSQIQRAFVNSAMIAGLFIIDAATLGAQASPVPWLGAALAMLATLRDMFRKFAANKNALNQLLDRCTSFLQVLEAHGRDATPKRRAELAQNAERVIRMIAERMKQWHTKSKPELFFKQNELESDIADCHGEINDCLTKLQISVALDTLNWQEEFSSNVKMDHETMLEYLSEIKFGNDIIQHRVQQSHDDIQAIMGLLQQHLPIAGENNRGLETNLYRLQKYSRTMLVDMNLKRGEVRLVGRHAIGGTPTADIYEGLYLNEEKVAVRMIRAIAANNPKCLQRFNREVAIWRHVWEVDQGRHILPLYGFCQNDGSFPYVVSPWMPNGSVDNYVKLHPSIDHRALIKHIAEGINILHTMSPPVVHGDIRGANILVDGSGNPLLADFGFARILEDITGVSVTMAADAGYLDSQRWAASELCSGARLTTKADVYSFGMTVLELLSHEKPWPTVKASCVVLEVANGKKPPRPSNSATISRGLDDRMWELLQKCWEKPQDRPTMAELLRQL